MSIVLLKNKSKHLPGGSSNRQRKTVSGQSPGGQWIDRTGIPTQCNVGFSVGGNYRMDRSDVGSGIAFSPATQPYTPYRGMYPVGNGGNYGEYATPQSVFLMDNAMVAIEGNQQQYVNPTVMDSSMKIYQWKQENSGNCCSGSSSSGHRGSSSRPVGNVVKGNGYHASASDTIHQKAMCSNQTIKERVTLPKQLYSIKKHPRTNPTIVDGGQYASIEKGSYGQTMSGSDYILAKRKRCYEECKC